MPKIILDRSITDSPFTPVDKDAADPGASNVLLPLSVWQQHKDELKGRNDIGIWLDAEDEVESLEGDLNRFPVIGVNFPTFFDGRSLSTANLLRRKYGYQGEIRAIGDVRRDQMDQMQRCGINAFQLEEGRELESALLGLEGFTNAYQDSIDRPEPLFRKR